MKVLTSTTFRTNEGELGKKGLTDRTVSYTPCILRRFGSHVLLAFSLKDHQVLNGLVLVLALWALRTHFV